MIVTDLKTGTIFKENGSPFIVLKYEHIKSARGGANVKVKARNLVTGQVLEKSYIATAKAEDADIRRQNAQYLYQVGENYMFMDPDTFDQISIHRDTIGEPAQYLKEGEKVQIMYFEDKPVSVDLPITMIFTVKYTEPGFRGNTISNVYKDAELDNGAKVKVPTFVKIGDSIKIDTRTGDYVSKS